MAKYNPKYLWPGDIIRISFYMTGEIIEAVVKKVFVCDYGGHIDIRTGKTRGTRVRCTSYFPDPTSTGQESGQRIFDFWVDNDGVARCLYDQDDSCKKLKVFEILRSPFRDWLDPDKQECALGQGGSLFRKEPGLLELNIPKEPIYLSQKPLDVYLKKDPQKRTTIIRIEFYHKGNYGETVDLVNLLIPGKSDMSNLEIVSHLLIASLPSKKLYADNESDIFMLGSDFLRYHAYDRENLDGPWIQEIYKESWWENIIKKFRHGSKLFMARRHSTVKK